ncbi:MAG: DUF1178 family protein [Alphaproteobacteria bacterium]
MIHFNLKCACGNKFDAWFKSGEDYDNQCQKRLLNCPLCGGCDIEKAPMSPNLGKKSFKEVANSETNNAAKNNDNPLAEMVSKVKESIKKNCEYVGSEFPAEARKMYYGEKQAKGIYGETSTEEAKKLKEEGIDVISLPFPIKTDS